jgi:hypothetical protein
LADAKKQRKLLCLQAIHDLIDLLNVWIKLCNHVPYELCGHKNNNTNWFVGLNLLYMLQNIFYPNQINNSVSKIWRPIDISEVYISPHIDMP